MFKAEDIIITLLMSNHKVKLDNVDMPLKKSALDDIEVMMGPRTTSEDKSKVRQILYPCLINRLFSKKKIVDSSLRHK